ncbi:hypothetical protein FQP81_18425 [Pseudoalteromonas distincta]|nr:hypothetical protein [Pseudoalteromonas sp. GutCa3]PKG68654.1 hypothetical protein CXF64_20240 [Pseudoalteromonas sp. GutCa3]TVU70433.1 hypothetical protein FQP81_18425 [Pseudoalteromonas elyakovii]
MEIEYTEKVQRTVKLDRDQCSKIATQTILNAFDLTSEHFIEEGHLMRWVDLGGRFRPERELVREATEQDKMIFLIMNKIK